MSDNELGEFLRACRESVTPAEVGLPTAPRRRTPGLRRAELATLAGISVEYLTRLEQGRDRHPSGQVLGALANAMRLSYEQRLELRRLSKKTSGLTYCMEAEPPARTVRPTVRALLDGFEPGPAIVVNRLGEVLAHTAGYARLAGPVGLLDGDPPSLVRYLFTDPRARTTFPDWDHVADERVAALTVAASRDDPHVAALADELALTAGPEFSARLNRPARLPASNGVQRMTHPEAGELRLSFETLDLPEADGQQIVVYLPADRATEAALAELGRPAPGALRVVRG
ncbi:helix-turn-helix domain-containing protein [Thermopolyspora sp. NPDC052614]|uniref:helix-turn-helix domain-containing protein n=1 Tax=Thermopolyspora sp. NPDC052614 TaxID=3155682 RepID=UPI00343EDB29